MSDPQHPYIQHISIDLFDGIFQSTIEFQPGLNIISGENGTGKTQVINQLKGSPTRKFARDVTTDRIVVFNPLRNAEKRTQEDIVQNLRTQNVSIQKINVAMQGFAINDWKVATYRSFGELFVLAYEDLFAAGGIPIEKAVKETRDDFNTVLQKVFPEFEIIAKWKEKQLNLSVRKMGSIDVPINSLSRGESEVFAIIFNIYANRNEEDIYLIDEPELHLNWDLEYGLFRFLDWFCREFDKQIIATTHSRIIFNTDFLHQTQFLIWRQGQIVVEMYPTEEIKTKIGGDALKLVTAFETSEAVFYVEDNGQRHVVEFLANHLSKDVFVSIAGNRDNVKSLCRYITREGSKNAYFLIDGDNMELDKDLRGNERFIHLQKYSIENYFLKPAILAKIADTTEEEMRSLIREKVKEASIDTKTLVFRKLADIAEIPEEILDTYNAKNIIGQVATSVGQHSPANLMDEYLKTCAEENVLEDIFSEITEKIQLV
ncbi:MAG: AAA family ATPase [Candidatus Poribacteria bacterium]|nr:AAA family ATPase [Candidatus Poribacteria bacterium]